MLDPWPWWGQFIVGFVAVGSCVIGIVVSLGKSIDGVANHEWRTCACSSCMRKRRMAWDRQRPPVGTRNSLPPRPQRQLISTRQLTSGMMVAMNGVPFKVHGCGIGPSGYEVQLTNLRTNRRFVSAVEHQWADQKMWEPLSVSRG